jgi:hypothetical protein
MRSLSRKNIYHQKKTIQNISPMSESTFFSFFSSNIPNKNMKYHLPVDLVNVRSIILKEEGQAASRGEQRAVAARCEARMVCSTKKNFTKTYLKETQSVVDVSLCFFSFGRWATRLATNSSRVNSSNNKRQERC